MKLVNVQSKWWWVPASNPMVLAVQIQTEQEYLPAIKAKLRSLLEAEDKPLEMATWMMEPQGLEVQPTDDLDNLVEQLLATSSLGEMVRAGAPWNSDPEKPLPAMEAVESQESLNLSDFLT